MVQKLSLTSVGPKFLSFWYCDNCCCVIMLKCRKCLDGGKNKGDCGRKIKLKGCSGYATGQMVETGAVYKQVCTEEEVRCLITQSSLRAACCGTEKVKNNHGHWRISWLKAFLNRLNKTVGNRKLCSNLHVTS